MQPSDNVPWLTRETFLSWFTPDRKRFAINLSGWKTVNQRLTDRLVESALNGEETIGFFSRNRTSVLIIDVDAHARERDIPSKLQASVEAITRSLGMNPSLAFRTPRGLHLVFFFRYTRSTLGLTEWVAGKKIHLPGKLSCECRPSVSHAIRIPSITSEVDPFTLGRRITTGPPPIFDPPDLRVRTRRKRPENRVQRKERPSTVPDLSDIVFARGESNKAFTVAAGRLFASSVNKDEALVILERKLNADGYRGPLSRQLASRLASTYRNLARRDLVPKVKAALSKDWTQLIEHVVVRAPFRGQRRRTFRRFVTSLYSWRCYLAAQNEDKASFEYRCDLYPSYRKASKRGAFPLPYALLRSWSDDHTEFMRWLESESLVFPVLEHRQPFSPDTQDKSTGVPGASRYYWIELPGQATKSTQDPGQSYNNNSTIMTELDQTQINILRDRDRLRRRSAILDVVLSSLNHSGILEESDLLESIRTTSPRLSMRALLDCVSSHPAQLQRYRVERKSDRKAVHLIAVRGSFPDSGYRLLLTPTEATRQSILSGLLAIPEEEFAVTIDQARALARDHFLARTDVRPMPTRRQFDEYFRRQLKQLVTTGHVARIQGPESILYRRIR